MAAGMRVAQPADRTRGAAIGGRIREHPFSDRRELASVAGTE